LGFRIGQSSGECDAAISLYPADWPFAIFKVLTGEHPIKMLPEKPEPVLLAKIRHKVAGLGRIHALQPCFSFS
jgi:hypothetical protein